MLKIGILGQNKMECIGLLYLHFVKSICGQSFSTPIEKEKLVRKQVSPFGHVGSCRKKTLHFKKMQNL